MEWVDGVEQDTPCIIRKISKFMTPAQYKALMAALGRKRMGALIWNLWIQRSCTIMESLIEDLWKALYASQSIHGDGMAAAGVRAIEEMALTYNNDNRTIKASRPVFANGNFPSDGKTTSHTPGVQPVLIQDFTLPGYGHKKEPSYLMVKGCRMI